MSNRRAGTMNTGGPRYCHPVARRWAVRRSVGACRCPSSGRSGRRMPGSRRRLRCARLSRWAEVLLVSDHLSSTCIGASLCSRYALSKTRSDAPASYVRGSRTTYPSRATRSSAAVRSASAGDVGEVTAVGDGGGDGLGMAVGSKVAVGRGVGTEVGGAGVGGGATRPTVSGAATSVRAPGSGPAWLARDARCRRLRR